MLRPFSFAILLLGSVWLDAGAQFALVQGQVVDADSKAAMPGANVRLESDEQGMRGTATNDLGHFSFSGIRPGSYVLTATHVGYLASSDTVMVGFGGEIYRLIPLEEERERMEEVLVESGTLPAVEARGAGHVQIRPVALLRVPMPDVSADLMAFLTTRPGVVAAGDRGGQLFIRGGTPTQNLILLDGMRLFQPFHIVGFYSVFPSDIIAEADFFAGGFGARYGGRISSVIDVTTRNGSKQRLAGAVSVAPFLASIRVEVPFVPEKVSILASARESIIERLAPGLLGKRLPYRFGDRFMKLHAYLNPTSSFSATLLDSFDEGDIAGLEESDRISTWRNTAFGGRYIYLPADYPLLAEFAVYGTRFSSRYRPSQGPDRASDVGAINADIRFAYLLGDLQLHFGIASATHRMTYNLGVGELDRTESVTEGALFTNLEWTISKALRIEPGIRLQSYSSGIGSSLEPRFRIQWRPGGGRTLSAAWGIYHQQIIGLNNQRDVTDAFIAWAPSPDNSPLPRSMHAILGWREKLGASLELGAETYYRSIDNISFPLFTDGLSSALERMDGTSRGIDLTADLTRPLLYVHAGYSLSAVEYVRQSSQSVVRPGPSGGLVIVSDPATNRFSPPHDRRHQFNILAQISSGSFRASVRWHFGSGLPYTQIHGFYRSVPPSSPDDAEFFRDEGSVELAYGKPYASRLPSYHRLDVSAERDFAFSNWRLVLQAGIVNLYDRNNIFSYDLLLGRRVDQLPLIPSVGVRVEVM